jgi:hypothetical protein
MGFRFFPGVCETPQSAAIHPASIRSEGDVQGWASQEDRMQAPLRDSEKDKSFWRAIGLGAWEDPRKGRRRGGSGPEPAALLSPPDDGTDRPMIRPSARLAVAIRAHRADWP